MWRVGFGGCGVFGVGSGDEIERERDVAHRLGHWPHRVVVRVERHDAGAADQARGSRGSWPAMRTPDGFESELQVSVPKAERGEAGGDGGRAAAARTGGAERRVVGVADRAADGADAEIAEGKLVEIGFAEDDGAALAACRRRRASRAAADDRQARANRPWWEGRGRRCCL